MNNKIIIGIVVVIIIIIVGIVIYNKRNKKTDEIPTVKRPFLNIYTDDGRKINVVFITHPYTNDNSIIEYNNLKNKNINFLGMSSYSEFPGMMTNPHDPLKDKKYPGWNYNYFTMTEGWCHCFKQPSKYIPADVKQTLISESDFHDFNVHKPSDIKMQDKEYDFIYICLKDDDKCSYGWQAHNRNWEGALKYLEIMCRKYKLKGCLIGRINCKIPDSCHNLLNLTDFMDYSDFIKMYDKCKFIFLPNLTDASPRVLTEAMDYNLPILVNENILGGWKYVNEQTGVLFNDGNFENQLDIFIKNLDKYKPREYFINNYGPENSGKRLLQFVKECIPQDKLNIDLNTIKYLKPGI